LQRLRTGAIFLLRVRKERGVSAPATTRETSALFLVGNFRHPEREGGEGRRKREDGKTYRFHLMRDLSMFRGGGGGEKSRKGGSGVNLMNRLGLDTA